MPEVKKVLAYKLLDRCGVRIEYIGRTVLITIKEKEYLPFQSIQQFKQIY